MRRALLERLPALSKFYGLTPADIDQMTTREISEYVQQMDEYHQREQEAERRGK